MRDLSPHFFVFKQIFRFLFATFRKYLQNALTNMCMRVTFHLSNNIGGLQYMETKRERFVRIVENRTNKIIDMLRLLGNCANKSNYDYTDADVQKVFNTLEKELKAAKLKYSASGMDDDKFKL